MTSKRTLSNVSLRIAASIFAYASLLDIALAYRPFDGTDAAVADPGEMEVELQPAGGKNRLSRRRPFSTTGLPRTGRLFLRVGWKHHFLLRAPRPLRTAEHF